MGVVELLTFLFVLGLIFGGFGAYVATTKGRSAGEGFLFGAFLGPIGCLIEALLPTIELPEYDEIEPVGRTRPVEGWQPPPPDKPSPADDPAELAAFSCLMDPPPKPTQAVPMDAIEWAAKADAKELRRREEEAIREMFGKVGEK